jgi:hypothetical protein
MEKTEKIESLKTSEEFRSKRASNAKSRLSNIATKPITALKTLMA